MIKYFFLLLLSISAFAIDIPDPFPEDSVKYATMPNGLRVVVKENHATPIVAVSVVINAGSGIINSKGIPHYLEHLSFQSTQKYPSPLSAQYLIEEKGGYCTGSTNRDSTRFEGVITSDKIDLMLSVLSQVTLHPILSNEAFERERPTILAEIQRYSDDPEISLLNSAYYYSYRNHPYANPTTGTIQNILLLTGDDIRDFHKRWYKPANMSLVVVGDIKSEYILNAAEKYFTLADKSPFLPTSPIKVPPQEKKQISSVTDNDTDVWQAISLPTSAASDFPGCSTADILTTMLVTGKDALIYKWLKDANITVISTGGEYITSDYPGRIIIWIHTTKKDADYAKKILLTGLSTLSQTITDEMLAKTKIKVKAEYLMNNETFARQAATLAIYQAMNTGQYSLADYIQQIDAVTSRQVGELAATQPVAIIAKGGSR
jgi:zinc protease